MEYFQYVRRHLFGDYVKNLRIKSGEVDDPVRVEADGVDPKTLVEGAARLLHEDKKDAKKESYDPFAVVWAVTDVDDFGKNGDKLRAAVDKGRQSGVEVIISNPCFDVWLIDHKQPCPLSYTQTSECEKLAKRLGLIDIRDAKGILSEIKTNPYEYLKLDLPPENWQSLKSEGA